MLWNATAGSRLSKVLYNPNNNNQSSIFQDTPAEELYEIKTAMIVEGAKLEINCHDEELSDVLPIESEKGATNIDRPFKCDVCPKTFKIKRTLYAHKRFTHGTKEHCCPICGKPIAYR